MRGDSSVRRQGSGWADPVWEEEVPPPSVSPPAERGVGERLRALARLGIVRQTAATAVLVALAFLVAASRGPVGSAGRRALAWVLRYDVNLRNWERLALDLGHRFGINNLQTATSTLGRGELPTDMGPLVPPVADSVSSWFGWREVGGRPEFHQGLDFRAPAGQAVQAVAAGTVRQIGNERLGYGLFVILAHKGGWESLYAHCSVVPLRAGEAVAQGMTVCRLGSTGRSEGPGPSLHFELRRDGQAVDPAPYLGKAAPVVY